MNLEQLSLRKGGTCKSVLSYAFESQVRLRMGLTASEQIHPSLIIIVN